MKENFPFTYFLLRYMLGFLAVILGVVAVLVIITYFMTNRNRQMKAGLRSGFF